MVPTVLTILAYVQLSNGGGGEIIFSNWGIEVMKIALFFANFSLGLKLV